MKYANLVFEMTSEEGKDSVWPGYNCTLPSMCSHIWRSMMPKDSEEVGLIPYNQYVYNGAQSKVALQWLKYLDRYKYGGRIQYSGKDRGEKLIRVWGGSRHVDSYLPPIADDEEDNDDEKGVVFEFLGCYFHGCMRCFKPHEDSGVGSLKIADLNSKTMNDLAKLREASF